MSTTGNGVYGTRFIKPTAGINLDFKNPVNQREIVSGESNTLTNAYWLDMWKLDGIAVWTQGMGVTLVSGTKIRQYFEVDYHELLGKTYTVSMTVDGEIKTAALTFPAAADGETIAASAIITGMYTVELGFEYRSDGTLICNKSQQYVPFIRLTALAEITVSRIKIERGSYSTMAWDAPADYRAELLKCQRYYYSPYRVAFEMTATNNYSYDAAFHVTMRTNPTVIHTADMTFLTPGVTATGTVTLHNIFCGTDGLGDGGRSNTSHQVNFFSVIRHQMAFSAEL